MRHTGTVIWFNAKRGYGFVAPDVRAKIPALVEGKDLFVHYSQISSEARRKNLYEGQRVEFEVVPDEGRDDGVMAGAVLVI
jgi:CspA family cold shock protein